MTGYSRAGQELQEKDWGFYIFAAGVCAFFAAYGIGANDVANCFATSVGSKALTVKQAVVIASVCEFFGALLMGSNVAKTIRKGIADVNCYKDNPGLLIYGMTCVIIAVAIWLVLASYLELPVSTTHSCVGGIIGMTLMTRSTRCVIWNKDPANMAFENFPWTGGVAQIVISWVLSPVASGVCAAALYAVVRYGIFASWLFAKCCFGWVITLVVVGTTTALLVGPSPEPLKGEYCDNYCQVNSREWMQ